MLIVLPQRTNGLSRTTDRILFLVCGRYSDHLRLRRSGRRPCAHPIFGLPGISALQKTQSPLAAFFRSPQIEPEQAHTVFLVAPLLSPRKIADWMHRVIILWIDFSQQRVSHHECPLNAHVSIPLPQFIHGRINSLPLIPLFVVLKHR